MADAILKLQESEKQIMLEHQQKEEGAAGIQSGHNESIPFRQPRLKRLTSAS